MWNWYAGFWNRIERDMAREHARRVHEVLYQAGYRNQISFYGTLVRPYDGRHTQARIELLAKEPWTPKRIRDFHGLFQSFQPDKEYTLIIVTPQGLKEAL